MAGPNAPDPNTNGAREHTSKLGASLSGLHHAIGDHEKHGFSDKRTVPPEATIDGQVHEIDVGAGEREQGVGHRPSAADASNGIQVLCGPLLNYRRTSNESTDNPIWHGSVLLVTQPGHQPPPMVLRLAPSDLDNTRNPIGSSTAHESQIRPQLLYEDPKGGFWRYKIELQYQGAASTWEYNIPDLQFSTGSNENTNSKNGGHKLGSSSTRTFAVPSRLESMRIMFHSCNGFSAGTDEAAWSGPALWNDVLRAHKENPFHIMIGGGDQIYNDMIRVSGPLKPWTEIKTPHHRKEFPFNEDLRAQCDTWYFENYIRWYGMSPFSDANGQIPQLNIWDDHDIIDGFGSYTNHFMRSPVFRGIGSIATKWYYLFQHHIPPAKSTFTTDAPQTTEVDKATGTTAADAIQLRDSWVMTSDPEDPSFIVGKTPGPYVEERSHSIYCQLGARMAFLGIDARTERTRHQINYPETYDLIFNRADQELASSNGRIKHLILLLGVPIAYPRLQWLENILHSPIIGPLRFLNKRFGMAGGFFNSFDGSVDLLDDLDDHYTARQHKKERKQLIQRLQVLSKKHNVRVTILSGDVHLAAVGRFYSAPNQQIKAENDWRFMVNVVSSAITNKPPPQAVANLLARRNKIHHLDTETDETLLNMFDKDPSQGHAGVKPKTAKANNCTMPSRNYAVIRESSLPSHDDAVQGAAFEPPQNPRQPLHKGEVGAGSAHPTSSGAKTWHSGAVAGGLDVNFRIEIDPHDRTGQTTGYGFSIPPLDCK